MQVKRLQRWFVHGIGEVVGVDDYNTMYLRVVELEQALRECDGQVGEDGNPWEVIPRIIARCEIPPIKPVFE